jgi:RNA-binding protein YlmH
MLHLKELPMWHGLLAVTVGNKPFLAAWLVTLSLAVGAVGDKVFVERTAEIAILQVKLDQIQATLDEINTTTKLNRIDLTTLMVEQARVKQELQSHTAADARPARQ